jgi:hypothetical protein
MAQDSIVYFLFLGGIFMFSLKSNKHKLRKGFLLDLVLMLLIMTAPVWTTLLIYSNIGGIGVLVNVCLHIFGFLGVLFDGWLLAQRITGTSWY